MRTKSFAIAFFLASAVLTQTSGAQTSNTKPTAKEIFELRGACIELGDKMEHEDKKFALEYKKEYGEEEYGLDSSVNFAASYNARTNHCYVEKIITRNTKDFSQWYNGEPSNFSLVVQLFDGQTRGLLYSTHMSGKTSGGEDFTKLLIEERPRAEIKNKIDILMSEDGGKS